MPQTPRLNIPYPDDFSDPWFEAFKNMKLQEDTVLHSLSENDNMQFMEGGDFSWSTGTNILSWSGELKVRSFTSPFEGTIAAQSFELEENDILFFQMFRSLTANFSISLQKGKVTSFGAVRNSDLVVFAYRRNGVVYMPGQNSIVSGDLGPVFGGGLGSGGGGTPSDHVHLPALDVSPGGIGITSILLPITAPILLQVRVYRNGQRLAEGAAADYTLDLGLGTITLIKPTVDAAERIIVDMIRTP